MITNCLSIKYSAKLGSMFLAVTARIWLHHQSDVQTPSGGNILLA